MNNFIFENKTKVYFGRGGVREYLGCLLKKYGDMVMLAYGGGSIKKNGVYDEVKGILTDAGKTVVEFGGIMPNPTYAKVKEGARIAKESGIDLILAVGGGSVSDSAKSSRHRQKRRTTSGICSTQNTPIPPNLFPSAPSSPCSGQARK